MKRIIYSLAILSGTIIGAGLFSLPYIASQVGILVILGYFFILGGIVIILHLLFAEVALETPDFLRLPGYARIYLGKWGEKIAIFSVIFGFWGTILVYLIIGGQFLSKLLSPLMGGSTNLYTLLYFIFGATLIFFGIKTIAKVELIGLVLFFIVLAVIFFQGSHYLKIENLSLFGGWQRSLLFLPFGPILFSLWGASLIPEIEEMLGGKKRVLKKIVPIAIFIPMIAYLIFIFLILGICGEKVSREAVSGLQGFLGNSIIYYSLLLFGILDTFTSFIALGLTLKKVFWYDLKIPKNLSWVLTCSIPLSLFLIGFHDFIKIIGLVGGVMIGIEGILIILMYQICKKIPRHSMVFFSTSLLVLIFILGIIYEIIYFIKG